VKREGGHEENVIAELLVYVHEIVGASVCSLPRSCSLSEVDLSRCGLPMIIGNGK